MSRSHIKHMERYTNGNITPKKKKILVHTKVACQFLDYRLRSSFNDSIKTICKLKILGNDRISEQASTTYRPNLDK